MKLCIIAPCKDSSPGPARDSLVELACAWTAYTHVAPSLVSSWQNSNIADVRARLAERALEDKADLYLWIDDDIVAKKNDLATIIDALIDANADVVSGCYQQRVMGGQIVAHKTSDGERNGALLEVDMVGFGFVLMRSSVMEAIVAERPFNCRSERDRVRGEDEAFSHWWRAQGGRLWLHTGILLGHIGPHVFQATLGE